MTSPKKSTILSAKEVASIQSSFKATAFCRGHSTIFNILSSSRLNQCNQQRQFKFKSNVFKFFNFNFPRVYADGPPDPTITKSVKKENESTPNISSKPSSMDIMDEVARAYIAKESGWDRVKMIFEEE